MPPVRGEAVSQRLMSLDALRGFDMFWIIGADALVGALHRMMTAGGKSSPVIGFFADQLEHVDWAGFHFYDLIFPLFVFMAGISVVFSLSKTIKQEGRPAAVKRIFTRFILLYLAALFYSGGFSEPWPHLRLMGVLNRIALCYFFAGLIFCFCGLRAMIAIAASLLVVYWALMTFVPIRNIQLAPEALAAKAHERGVKNDAKELFYATTDRVTGHYEPGFNLANHIDFEYLPGRLWDTYYDPEGLLSTMPAIVTCLLGVFAGLLILNTSLNDQQKVIYLIGAGIILANVGWIWGMQFPVAKKIWSSSFVLVAGGYSALLLAVFYWIIDIAQWRWWCQPFVWMGMNSITIYLTKNILGGFGKISERFAGGDIHDYFERHLTGSGDLMLSIVGLLLAFWFVHLLYRKKVFLRL